MKNSRLIEILKTFSREEMKEFDKYIGSPFFGCRKFVMEFFRILKKYYPEFRESDIDKRKLFREMYGSKKFNDGLMRRINSEIIKHSLDYLALKRFRGADAFRNNCLLPELRNRKLDKLFLSKAEQIVSDFNESKTKDLYKLLDKYLTDIEIFNYKTLMNDAEAYKQLERILESDINLFSYSLFNVEDKLKLIGYEPTLDVTKKFSESGIAEKLFSVTSGNDKKNLTIFKAIHYAYNIIIDKHDEDSYEKLKELLASDKDHFDKNQLRTFYSYIFYYFNHYSSRNSDKYFKDEFEIYKLIIKDELFLNYSSHMSIFFCRNYIIACRRNGSVESIQRFADDYAEYFIPEYREDLINYCRAITMLEKAQFGKALEYSAKIKLDVPQYRNDIKTLRIKCYYELNYPDSLMSEIDSLKHFFDRLKKDSKHHNLGSIIDTGNNFLKHLTSALKLKDKFSEERRDRLINEIEKEEFLNEKKWLVKVLNIKD